MKKNPNVKYAVVRTGNRSINTLGFLMYKIVYKKLLCSTRRAQQEENEIFSARYKNRKKEFYMEFRDLKQQYQLHKKQIDDAIQRVLTNTNFIQGSEVSHLEEVLAEYVGVKHCITCANGTDALQLALMTWDIGAGDAVFIPDFTFFQAEKLSL